jgi:hypothetical protein
LVGGSNDKHDTRAAVLLSVAAGVVSFKTLLANHEHVARSVRDVPKLNSAIDKEYPRAIPLIVIDIRAIVVTDAHVVGRGCAALSVTRVPRNVFAACVIELRPGI